MAPSYWLLFFLWARWLTLKLAGAQEQPWQDCSGSVARCGNLTISDPFWLVHTDTGRSCGSGSPDFEVTCYNRTPILRGHGLSGFEIVDITYVEHSLRVIDLGKLKQLQASNSCDVLPSWNTFDKLFHPFRISNINHNLIFYNCTEAESLNDMELVETKMGCGNQHKVFVGVGGRYKENGHFAAH